MNDLHAEQTNPPTLGQLLRWLTSITRPVHRPLYVSTLFRIVNLTLDVALFALAAGGVVGVITGTTTALPVFLWLVLCAAVKATAYYLEQFTGHYVAFKALELLRTAVFARLWPKAPAVVASSKSGDLLASLTRDVDRIEVVYAHTFAPVVSAFVVPTGILLATGATVGWNIVVVPALCLLLSLIGVPLLGTRASIRQTRETLELRRGLTHHLTDSVFGVEEVVGYGRQSERLAETEDLGRQVALASRKPVLWTAVRRAANLVLMLVSAFALVTVSLSESQPIWLVAALAGGALRLFEGPRGIEDAVGYLDHSLAAARRLWEISEAPPAVVDGPEEFTPATPPTVVFDHVSFDYGNGRFALEDFTLHVEAGTHTVLVGASGSGKSTVLQLLLRYEDPSSGRILLDGKPINQLTLDSLRRAVVAVPQRNQLLEASILENARLGVPDATEDEVWKALAIAHLDAEVREMPGGLDTPVGQGGQELSGGQAQRLCLARALLMRPRLLILDEFTASLNAELEAAIRADLTRNLSDVTIIEVSHRLEATADADQVVVVDRGQVAEVEAR